MLRLKLFCFVCLLIQLSSGYSQDFYISPSGNDDSSGLSDDEPFQSLARAQQSIRDLKSANNFKEAVTIHLAPGTYVLQKPLSFDIRDNGFAGREIHWLADQGKVIISGGIELNNCENANKNMWSCAFDETSLAAKKNKPASNSKSTIPEFSFFVNQHRMELARWPDKDWAYVKQPLTEKNSFISFNQLPNLTDAKEFRVHIFAGNDWFDEYIPVASHDTAQRQITLATNTTYPLRVGARYYFQNIFAELNMPGEWFYDQAAGKILFLPPENTRAENIIVSSLPSLINIQSANYLSFENIAFRYTNDSAITIKDAHHISFRNIEINAVNHYAIDAENSTEISLINSHIHHTGEGGISIFGGDRINLKPSNNLIYNNHFHDTGNIMFAYGRAINSGGVGSKITHNRIENLPGPAIYFSGNNHLIEKNDISHICEQSADCGAVYAGRNWTWRGNIIHANNFHDIFGYNLHGVDIETGTVNYLPEGAFGVYLDDGMSGVTVTGNIFNQAGSKAVFMGGGRDNIIDNNIIFTDNCAIYLDNRWPDYLWDANRKTLKEVPIKNSVWSKSYPELNSPMQHDTWPEGNTITHNLIITLVPDIIPLQYNFPADSTHVTNNLVWSATGPVKIAYNILDNKQNGIIDWQDWLKLGIEKNSTNQNPCVTITGNTVNFCANSPIKKLGFKPLSSDMGIIK